MPHQSTPSSSSNRIEVYSALGFNNPMHCLDSLIERRNYLRVDSGPGLSCLCLCLVGLFLVAAKASAVSLTSTSGALRIEITGSGPAAEEKILVRVGHQWVPALSAISSSVRVGTSAGIKACVLSSVDLIENGILLKGDCGVGLYEQRVVFSADADVLNVSTRLMIASKAVANSAEDRYDFVPDKYSVKGPLESPIDFVWSQNIKREAHDLIATNEFKSPAIMMQQGEIFTALMPSLNDRNIEPLALDLDVTSEKRPWMSYGAVPSEPYGHSYFRRVSDKQPKILANEIQYTYSIIASRQPIKLGYRRIVRDLWKQYGHPGLLNSPDMQQNVVRPELNSFNSWRAEAWHTYADQIYVPFDCGGKRCGTLSTNRDLHTGGGAAGQPDAWFNAWFQTLRTAYGWYLEGRETHDAAMMAKADSVLTLALTAPRNGGAFATVYFVKTKQWAADDGWAGYADDYHAFCMSWQAYWMLKWAVDLEPQRKAEVLGFLEPYGKFLLKHQLSSGVIPSWYDASLESRAEFRDFNGETGVSALFLATLGSVTGEAKYTAASERAMNFVTEQVVPRQRWFDFETFLSCSRKPYDFYDPWTAQFPQNNLAEIQTVQAWLVLYQSTHKRIYLDRGTAALDYLLLTQQMWNNPMYTPKLLGGFTTQNTDSEWSDARQGYAATLLFDYFRETGNFEYLERSVAAARSGFPVAPWENWSHRGYLDRQGAMTGFHWGTGSAMTSVGIMSPVLGDAYIDLKAGNGVGFDECTVTDVLIDSERVSFQIASLHKQRTFSVRFAGIDPARQYFISWNGKPTQKMSGRDLLVSGVTVGPL